MNKSEKIRRDTKRVFIKKGACSHMMFFILNREFGYLKDNEECASDPLAGGIFQQGYQCGMLWGSALALGAESFRRHPDQGQAMGHAITATQRVMESFIHRTKSPDCLDITSCDFSSKFRIAIYMLSGKFWSCFRLADKWVPEAIQSAYEGLSLNLDGLPEQPVSCASEVARKMGASDEEIVMVSGFAGGLGLSGNGCGALSAAIWMNTLARVRKQNYKYTLSDPVMKKILETFYEATDYEMECFKISGRRFKTIDEHTDFIKSGGCGKLIGVLAGTNSLS
ncbi:MAG: C-GCAxxG-C-C family protein [bacterium]|nr:C-GCAxxG-C-C family protein [bacterium]